MFKSFKLRLYTGSSFLGVRDAAAITTPKFLKYHGRKLNKPAGADAASGAAVVAGVAPARSGTSAEMFRIQERCLILLPI